MIDAPRTCCSERRGTTSSTVAITSSAAAIIVGSNAREPASSRFPSSSARCAWTSRTSSASGAALTTSRPSSGSAVIRAMRRPLEDVGAQRHLARHRRQSPAGRLERLRHRERVHLVDLDPSLLERAAEARRETEQVEAREAEDGLADDPGLQQELERQPSTPADVREVARAAADHRIDQREGDAGEERAAHPDAPRQASTRAAGVTARSTNAGSARGPCGPLGIVGHEPATAAW